VTPTDYTFKWNTSGVYYRPYTDKTEAGGVASAGKFWNSNDNPTATNRLTYDGYFESTKLTAYNTVGTGYAIIGQINGTGIAISGNSFYGYAIEGYATNSVGIYGRSGYDYGGYFKTTHGTKIVGFDYNGSEVAYISYTGDINSLVLNSSGTTQTTGYFDNGTTTTVATTRLNYNGYLYSTKLYYGSTEVVTFPGFGTNHTTAAYGDHTHTGVYELILGNPAADGYVLSSTMAGVRSWIAASGGVTPVADILDWSTNKYTPYTTQQSSTLSFDTSSTDPIGNTRLNLNGYLNVPNIRISGSSFSIPSLNVSCSTIGQGAIRGQHTGGSYGIAGYSSTSNGGYFQSTSGSAINIVQTGAVTTSNSVVNIQKVITGTVNATGDIISISDSSPTSGTISGSILKAIIGSTVRIDMNPRVAATGGDAYILDTHNALTTSNLLNLKNQGTSKVFVNSDGEVELTTVSKGIILKSADGTRYRATMANGGTWTIAAA
jgi:hypothetical protein